MFDDSTKGYYFWHTHNTQNNPSRCQTGANYPSICDLVDRHAPFRGRGALQSSCSRTMPREGGAAGPRQGSARLDKDHGLCISPLKNPFRQEINSRYCVIFRKD